MKKFNKYFGRLLRLSVVKVFALTLAAGLLIFSILLTVSKGQNVLPDSDAAHKTDVSGIKDDLRRKLKTNEPNDLTIEKSLNRSLLAPGAGDVDLSFNPSLATYVGSIRASVLQPDGKLLVGGFFISINGISKYNLARFNPDGTLDASFTPKVSDGVYSINLQPDGKILITGVFTFVNGVSRNRIARLNTDGTLDTSFNPGGGADNVVYTTAIQPDGKIVAGGFFTVFNGSSRINIVRLNADGSIDSSFVNIQDNDGGFVWKLFVQPDNKILAAGNYRINFAPFTFARFNSDGTRDTSYNPAPNSTVRDFAVQTDGKILIGGAFTTVNTIARSRLARLNTDGTTDTAFNPGTGANSTIWSITLLPSGKALIGGQFTAYNSVTRNGIVQINADGSLDTSFNPGTGVNAGGIVYTVRLLPNGQLAVGGFFTQFNGVNRDIGVLLNADGSLDPTFALSTVFQANMRVAVTQFDGKIIVGGTFNRINNQSRGNIARLNADGTLDTTFNTVSGANSQVYTIALQNDGKILIGGSFTTFNGITRNRIARLNADGTLDTTFAPSSGANAFVSNIVIQPNNKILIAGSFTNVNGTIRGGIARLNADGTTDLTFSPPLGSVFVEGLALQPDGKIVVGGQFSETLNGITYQSLIRLNADGTTDTTFTPATAPNTGIYSMALQNDGKILIGGTFSSVGGVNQKGIARLNTNGSLDTSFNVGTGTSEGDDVEDIVVLPNGKVLISGLINSVNGLPRGNIARLNANGSLDTTFTAFADNQVWDIEVPLETIFGRGRRMFISGDFFTVNDIPRTGLASLFIEPSFNRTRFDFDGDGKTDYGVFRPADRVWYLQNSATGFAAAQFGLSTDKIVPADYDGDGKTDVAVYRDGTWYLLRSTLGFAAIQFGVASDIPLPADTTDDGQADLIVFRPSEGNWYRYDISNGAVTVLHWGENGDIPVSASAYYASEDGVTVFRPSNGVWYILHEGDTPQYIQFGQAGDIPVAADYDGDGRSDAAVYRNGLWYILQSSNGQVRIEQFGLAGDKPSVGDYDGDGKADLAVWRPSDRVFYVLRSNGNQFNSFQWGLSSDLPVASAYHP